MAGPERFAFGDNWRRYAQGIDEPRIERAVAALAELLGTSDLRGRRFLDVGCGSGIHSLAALRLGAHEVAGFDLDPDSVRCSLELRAREGDPEAWSVSQGSVLDRGFLDGLPPADVVYAWGVLHHTGDMWTAIRNAAGRCAQPGSLLVLGIYNERPWLSPLMRIVKRSYVRSPRPVRALLRWGYALAGALYGALRGRNVGSEMRRPGRGMDRWRDLEDWVGGYPFEYASVGALVGFVLPLGFELVALRAHRSLAAVNEYVFRRRGRIPGDGAGASRGARTPRPASAPRS